MIKAGKEYAHGTLMITKLILIMVVNNLRMLEMYAYNIYTNNNTQSLVAKVYLFGFRYEHYSVTQ